VGGSLVTLTSTSPMPIRYVRCASVDFETLERVLRTDLGWDLTGVGHLSVSRDFTMELQRKGVVRALPLGALVDAFEFSLMKSSNHELSIDKFPEPIILTGQESVKQREDRIREWLDRLSAWSAEIDSRRIRLSILIREIIYRELSKPDSISPGLREVLDSGGAMASAIRQVSEIGLRPENFQFKSAEGKKAGDLWIAVNQQLPDSRVLLDYLFIDHDDPANSRDSEQALQSLKELIRHAFNFEADDPPRLVYHGMYFYTPLQWALFELLARAGVEQVFVVHDDDKGPQFEIWRRFFSEAQELIRVETTTQTNRPHDPRADFLTDALTGNLTTLPEKLELIPFASIGELARHIRTSDRVADSRLARSSVYAAGTGDLNRKIARLCRLRGEHDDRMLFALPVGRFLIALQEAVRVKKSSGVSGIDFESLVHLVEGGYLNRTEGTGDRSLTDVLYQCKTYFGDCRTIEMWRSRLKGLELHYEPTRHGIDDLALVKKSRKRDNSLSDQKYLIAAVKGHLRRAPWLDLSLTEWSALKESLLRIFDEVEMLAQDDKVDVEKYIAKLIQLVVNSDNGVEILGEARWREVCDALNSLPSAPDFVTNIIRIGEILPALLGKRIVYGEQLAKESPRNSLASPLRGLEVCGLIQRDGLHVTNLSDTVFPYKPQAFGWPFRRDEVVLPEGRSGRALRTRIRLVDELERSGGLGDLYLLWLALNGTKADSQIKLSWLTKTPTENLNPSPLLALMLEVPKTRESVRKFAGGIKIEEDRHSARSNAQQPPLLVVSPLQPARELEGYLVDIHSNSNTLPALKAFGSVEICARRTALHWLTRTSSSYHERWQLEILYGNLLGLSTKQIMGVDGLPLGGEPSGLRDRWKSLLDTLWAWMTPAEREKTSSRSSIHQRVEPDPKKKSAKPEWLLTLQGKSVPEDGDRRDPRMSVAYQFALKPKIQDNRGELGVNKRLMANKGELLPKPHYEDLDDPELGQDPEHQMWYLCNRCPAARRCLERSFAPS